MRKVILIIMVFSLVFAFYGIAIASTEAPKDTKVEKKAEAKPDAKAATTKTKKSPSVVETKCAKCHKGDKDLKKVAEAKGIKTTDEMIKAIKEGPHANLHKKISDKDLKAVGKELFGDAKAVDTKKKDDAKPEVKKPAEEKKKEEVKKEAEKPKKKKPEGC